MSDIDAVLHKERLTEARLVKDRRKRTYTAELAGLSDGVFVVWEERPCLVWESSLWPWTAAGYDAPLAQPAGGAVTVLTPRSIVNTLAYGFEPQVHHSVFSQSA
jgi:hypothetical protein